MNKKKQRLIIRSFILLLLFTAVGYTLYANFTKGERGKVTVGDTAPNFALKDMNGELHTLDDYKGKGVFLNFWGTWCKPCEKEMPYMENQYSYMKDDGIVVLAVNVGEPTLSIKQFLSEYDFSYPILRDSSSSDVYGAYGVFNLPATYLINSDGKVVEIITQTMTEEKVRESMEKIMPDS